MEAYYSTFAEVFSTLPEGYLPKWLLFTSALGIFNSIQNFCTSSLTKRVYANKPEEGKIYIYRENNSLTSIISYTFKWSSLCYLDLVC